MKLPIKRVEEIDQDKCGVQIKRLRVRAGMSQTQLGIALGIKTAHMSEMERGIQRCWTAERFELAQKAIAGFKK